MVGAELRLEELERLLVQRDRLRRPAGDPVGDGQVVAAGERVGVVGAQRGLAHGAGPRVQADGPVEQAQAPVGPAQGVQQRPLGRLRPGELLVEPLAGPVQHVGHLHLPAVPRRVRAAERLHQERAHRLGLLPRFLRLPQRRLGLGLRLRSSRARAWLVAWLASSQLAVGPGLDARDGPQPDHAGHQRHRRGRHRRPVPPRPPPHPARDRLAPGRDRLVGHPPLDVVGQRPARGVAVLGLQRHRLEADRLQRPVDRRVELPRRRELAPLHRRGASSPTSSPSNGGLPVSRQ